MKKQHKAHSLVVGRVDTHKVIHVASVVDEYDRVLGSKTFATTTHGYKNLLTCMRSFGELERVDIEFTGTLNRPGL
jgi:transposase